VSLEPDIVADLKARFGVVRAHKVKGETFVSRTPTLEQLTGWMQAAGEEATERELAKILSACVVYPDQTEIAAARKRISSLSSILPVTILQACGAILARVFVPDESEMSEAMATALVAEEKKWSEEELFPIVFESGSFKYEAIVRGFCEREYRTWQKQRRQGDFSAFQATTKKVTVWGDSDSLVGRFPGLYLAIPDFLMLKAGLADMVEEGEL
jgi:hypothetical protein